MVEWLDPDDAHEPPPQCEDECCNGSHRPALLRMLHHAFVALPRDIAKPLIVGLVVAGVIAAVVPEDYFAGMLGTGIVPMLVMMAVGVPLYMCSTASVPIAVALMAKGISPGAALVFLITGPATNAAGISTIWHLMGARTALIYLGSIALTAMGSGLVLDVMFSFAKAHGADVACHGWHMPGWLGIASAVVLLAVLAFAIVPPLLKKKNGHCCGGHAGAEGTE